MSIEAVVVDASIYQPIKVDEQKLESLLKTASHVVFPGLSFFEFKPAIRCGEGTRHPDGVLLAPSLSDWWVVEVETHLHPVEDHIYPQLRDLAQGYYGPEAFGYLDRHRDFDPNVYSKVDVYKPSFVLVIDQLTAEVRQACSKTDFLPVECAPFRADRENRYALGISGSRPSRHRASAVPGLDLVLSDEGGVAGLAPRDGRAVPELPSDEVRVGDAVLRTFVTSGRGSIVVPLEANEVRERTGGRERFRLLLRSMEIVASDSPDDDITITL